MDAVHPAVDIYLIIPRHGRFLIEMAEGLGMASSFKNIIIENITMTTIHRAHATRNDRACILLYQAYDIDGIRTPAALHERH